MYYNQESYFIEELRSISEVHGLSNNEIIAHLLVFNGLEFTRIESPEQLFFLPVGTAVFDKDFNILKAECGDDNESIVIKERGPLHVLYVPDTSFSEYNPVATFPLNTDEKISDHLNQRKTKGYSFYDWINFDNYLESLMKVIADHYSKELETANKIAENISTVQLIEQNNHADRYDWNPEIEAQRKVIHEDFIFGLLPKLPLDDAYTIPTSDRPHLMSADDLSDAGSFFLAVLKEGLNDFAQKGAGYPGTLASFEEWADILMNQIQPSLTAINLQSNTALTDDQGLKLLSHYFSGLWD